MTVLLLAVQCCLLVQLCRSQEDIKATLRGQQTLAQRLWCGVRVQQKTEQLVAASHTKASQAPRLRFNKKKDNSFTLALIATKAEPGSLLLAGFPAGCLEACWR